MKLFRISFILFLFLSFGCGTQHRTAGSSSPDSIGTEAHKGIEQKYAAILGTGKNDISNKKLYSFIDEWYGTPYRYGGKTKKGVDCSGFSVILYKEVFGKELGGSSASLYNQCKKISKKELREGDLVFFKIDSKEISHVGIYLQNKKFVHASTKKGVMIDGLDEEYYRQYFWSGGRIK